MAETIKVLVSEEEVNERIKTLGKTDQRKLCRKADPYDLCTQRRSYFSCVNWLKESVCRFLWTLCV